MQGDRNGDDCKQDADGISSGVERGGDADGSPQHKQGTGLYPQRDTEPGLVAG